MYLGNQPALSYTSFAKQDFTTSATTSYTLDNPVANANELALFINFVRQEPTTAYTASGTNLNLTSATSASDDMYCVFLGKAVQTVNPPSGSVGLAQLSATGTKDSTTFLRGDNTFAEPSGGGITEADQWRYTTDLSIGSGDVDLTSNLERIDTSGQGTLGTGMTESSGIFTFPSTGIWYIISTMFWYANADTRFIQNMINVTINNSTYNIVASNGEGITINGGTSTYASSTVSSLVDVTDTSNVKVKFTVQSQNTSGSVYLRGNTSYSRTVFSFIRIGDT
jgi:hypothetical protein